MNRNILAVVLIAVLVASIGITIVIYSQKQSNQEANTYTIIGVLNYAPGHAIFPGVSAISITPNVSPEPSNITFTEANGVNYTVATFVFLDFPRTFNFPQNGYGIDYPVGFNEGDLVKVTGVMNYSTIYEWYALNVTSITHYSS